MRRKFKNLSYFLSTGIFLFLGCQTEEIPVTENRQKPIRRATKVSFSTFKQLTGLSDFNTTFTLSKSKGLLTRRTNESYTPEDFIVDTDQIIQTISGGKTSYTFLMTPKNEEKENSRFYLIVYDKQGSWLDMVIQSDIFIDADGNPNETGFREIYASAARGTGCTTVFTWVIKCNRKSKCADGVCDRCSICLKAGSERICGNDKEDYLDGGWTKPLQPNTGGGGSPNPETDSDEETVVNLPIQTIILRNDPCKDLKDKSENISFKEKMEELKGKAATQNFESAYAMYQNPADGLSFSPEAIGTVNEPAVELTLNMSSTQTPTNAIGFIHCHLDNGRTFKVFSFTDMIALAYVASVSTRPTSELGIFVVTASGTFALKVNDRIALKNNLLRMQMAQKSYEADYAKYVKKNDPINEQILGLLKFIKKEFKDTIMGIDMYRQTSDGDWEKLELSNNEKTVKSKKC